MAWRTAIAAAALAAGLVPLGAGCGGTLEGKYRRGELTSSTTTQPTTTSRPAAGTGATVPGVPSVPGPSPSSPASSTTSSTAPTSGNAVPRAVRGEPEGSEPGGSIVGSAAWRAVVQPLGGRHR